MNGGFFGNTHLAAQYLPGIPPAGVNAERASRRVECGICSWPVVAGESYVALRENDIDLDSNSCMEKARFPRYTDLKTFIEGRWHCRLSGCWRCDTSCEAVAVHCDCFDIFRAECKAVDALQRLWFAIECRSPWSAFPELGLDSDTDVAVGEVYQNAEAVGLPTLKRLPPELVRLIYYHSESCFFWRCISAASFSKELSTQLANSEPLIKLLLSMSQWERGSEPRMLRPEDDAKYVRLTFDDRGLKKMEKLDEKPTHLGWRSEKLAFVIVEQSQMELVMTRHQYGCARCLLPPVRKGYHIWDMPSPPRLEDCGICGRITQSMRFRTVDLQDASGLTIFYSHSKVYGMHAHTRAAPDATKSFQRLCKRRQEALTWVHLPIPPNDELVALGLRMKEVGGMPTVQKASFLVRTRLAGDVFLGPFHTPRHVDTVLCALPPRLLFHNTPDVGPATVFGTCPSNPPEDATLSPFTPFRPHLPANAAFQQAYVSTAPLAGVTRMQVLCNGEGCTKGILLDYDNGARRALGSCRLGLDAVTTYLKPSYLCRLLISGPETPPSTSHQAVQIKAGSEDTHDHEGDGWTCAVMEGTLEFWYSEKESLVRIDNPSDEESDD